MVRLKGGARSWSRSGKRPEVAAVIGRLPLLLRAQGGAVAPDTASGHRASLMRTGPPHRREGSPLAYVLVSSHAPFQQSARMILQIRLALRQGADAVDEGLGDASRLDFLGVVGDEEQAREVELHQRGAKGWWKSAIPVVSYCLMDQSGRARRVSMRELSQTTMRAVSVTRSPARRQVSR